MTEAGEKLRRSLMSIGRRARSDRWIRLSSRTLFIAGVVVFAILGYRRYHIEFIGEDPVRMGPLAVAVALAVVVAICLLLVRIAVVFGGPNPRDVARRADRKLELKDLAVSGLGAIDAEGMFEEEVVGRAATAVELIEPGTLYPAGASLLRYAAAVPFLLAALYLFSLPPWDGPIPTRRGGEEIVANGARPAPEPGSGKGENRQDPDEVEPLPEPGGEEAAADLLKVQLIPAKKVYEPTDPVTVFVLASPGEANAEPHDLSVTLVVDGEPVDLGRSIEVGVEEPGFLTVRAKEVKDAAPKLTPGKHVLSAVLTENGQSIESPPVEIEIRGDPGGDQQNEPPPPQPQSQPEPEPEPEPEEGEEPPPEPETTPRFVNPLFGPGETVKKKGYALVPDPNAPAGAPPRRVPIGDAAREAARRPETAVASESVLPADRETVTKYFELLRGAR